MIFDVAGLRLTVRYRGGGLAGSLRSPRMETVRSSERSRLRPRAVSFEQSSQKAHAALKPCQENILQLDLIN